MKTFQSRLQCVIDDGRLSIADLSIWFGRPYHTVRGWLKPRPSSNREEGYEPWAPYKTDILQRLTALEKIVKRRELPESLSPLERRAMMKAWRNEHDRGVSKTHPAA